MSGSGKYEKVVRINQGGMSEVFLGVAFGEAGIPRLCAIKKILPTLAEDAEFQTLFMDEAKISLKLNHANIVRVFDVLKADGELSLVMEYVDGVDLTSLVSVGRSTKRPPLWLASVLFIGTEAARGLHYAHTRKDEFTDAALGIVHRDVSPSNIMVSFDGEVKVADFGIAFANEKASVTSPGAVKGKLAYMSPEQLASARLDRRSDVFSLGIIIWELLAGRRLFLRANEALTMQAVQACVIEPSLRPLNPEVDAELEALILKALRPSRDDRYASALHFGLALSTYLYRRYPGFSSVMFGEQLKSLLKRQRAIMAQNVKRAAPIIDLRKWAEPSSGGDVTVVLTPAPPALVPVPPPGRLALPPPPPAPASRRMLLASPPALEATRRRRRSPSPRVPTTRHRLPPRVGRGRSQGFVAKVKELRARRLRQALLATAAVMLATLTAVNHRTTRTQLLKLKPGIEVVMTRISR